MNLHDEFFAICDELEAGVTNKRRINRFLEWTRKKTYSKTYSLYRLRTTEGVEVDPIKDAIVVQLALVAAGKHNAIESAALLRKRFALLDAPIVDDTQAQEQDAVERVRKIVNKVSRIKRLTQPEKGAEIARQVESEPGLWQAYRTAHKVKLDAVEHFTRLVQAIDSPRGAPNWLKTKT
jgi:hypothetical protein